MALRTKLKIKVGSFSKVTFQLLMFWAGRTLPMIFKARPWDSNPKKWVRDAEDCSSFSCFEALWKSMLISLLSIFWFAWAWIVSDQSSLIAVFLLYLRAFLLPRSSLSARWAKVGIPKPQNLIGELIHSVMHELA